MIDVDEVEARGFLPQPDLAWAGRADLDLLPLENLRPSGFVNPDRMRHGAALNACSPQKESGYGRAMDLSEFSTAPKRILIHDPADGAALGAMTGDRLDDCNFLDLPAAERFAAEYRGFRAALAEAAEVVTLAGLLGDDPGFRAEADANPNLMFVRDSSITLPWAPEHLTFRRGSTCRAGRRNPRLPPLRSKGSAFAPRSTSPTTNMPKAATCFRRWTRASGSC